MAANRTKRRKWSIFQPGHGPQGFQPFQPGICPRTANRLQLRDWFTSIGDYECPALADLLQVTTEAGL